MCVCHSRYRWRPPKKVLILADHTVLKISSKFKVPKNKTNVQSFSFAFFSFYISPPFFFIFIGSAFFLSKISRVWKMCDLLGAKNPYILFIWSFLENWPFPFGARGLAPNSQWTFGGAGLAKGCCHSNGLTRSPLAVQGATSKWVGVTLSTSMPGSIRVRVNCTLRTDIH